MSIPDDIWSARLHAAVDADPRAEDFDVRSYLQAGQRARRHRVRAAAASLAAAAVVLATATWAVLGARDDRALPPLPAATPTTTASPIRATNGLIAYGSTAVDGSLRSVRPGQAPQHISRSGAEQVAVSCPVWSPDGRRLAYGQVREDPSVDGGSVSEIAVAPAGRWRDEELIPLPGHAVGSGFDPRPCPLWSPDGRWVALTAADGVWLVDTRTRAVRTLRMAVPSDLEWRPGTDELAIAGDVGDDRADPTRSTPIRIHSVSSNSTRAIAGVLAAHITWSPDGTMLAYTGGEDEDDALRVVAAGGGSPRVLLAHAGRANHGIGPVWSPTGERIAYQRLLGPSGERHEVVLVDVDDATLRVIEPPTAAGRLWYPYLVTWSPDGTTLLYGAWSSAAEVSGVVVVPADRPGRATALEERDVAFPDTYGGAWAATQMWGRQP